MAAVSIKRSEWLPPRPRPRRLAWPRTSPFHGGNTGSNPVGDAIFSIVYGFLDLLSRSLTLHRDKTGAAASFKYKYSRGVERVSAFLGHRPARQPSVGLAL